MFNSIIDVIGAVCAVLLVWYMVRYYVRKPPENSQTEMNTTDLYIQKITQVTGISAYETFHKCAEDWQIPSEKVERDFHKYLSTQTVPYYVKDFVRKSQKDIDELYRGKGTSSGNKRLWVTYSVILVLFWGGALVLSLYVFPNFWPEELRASIHVGPP